MALSLFFAGCGGGALSERPLWERPGLEGQLRPEMGPPQPGDAAPDFTLQRTDGTSFHLADARGSWVLLHFTMTWCPYCDAEVEHLDEIADRYASSGVRVALIDVKEDAAHWHAYVHDHIHGASLVVLEDPTGVAAARYAPPRALPSLPDRAQAMAAVTVVVDPAGKIRLFMLPDTSHYDPTLGAILAEMDRMRGVASPPPLPPRVGESEGGNFEVGETTAAPELLAPEAVVDVRIDPPAIRPHQPGELAITLHVADGYHTMSDHPSDPLYIATTLTLDPAPPLTFGAPVFPPSATFHLGDADLSVFEGDVVVRVPVSAAAGAPHAPVTVHGSVRYQACTTGSCLPPVTKPFESQVYVGR